MSASRCPSCGKPTAKNAPHAPFCSSRCQATDLGAWLTEAYRIPVRSAEAEDEDGDSPPRADTEDDDEE